MIKSLKNTAFTDILEILNVYRFTETIPKTHTDIEEEKNYTDAISSNSSTGVSLVDEVTTRSKDIELLSDNENIIDIDQASDNENIIDTEQTKCMTDPFLITWNGKNDPEIPTNWSDFKKFFTVTQLIFASWIAYTASSIYVPGQEDIEHDFHSSHVVATLNLSMFVLGYGVGPMLLSPLSEVAVLGRQPIYIWSQFVFTFIQIGCATVNNMAGLIIMRLIAGIACSPVLTNSGASVMDCIKPKNAVPVLAIWSFGTVFAPAIAPLLGACMTVAKNWRWSFWLVLFLSAFSLFFLFFTLPETSHTAILSRRAKRIRKQTGDNRYYTIQEKLDSQMKPREFLLDTLYRPVYMIFSDPVILAFDVYISVVYGVFYLFFEAFPIVFVDIYHFNLIQLGVSYIGFSVGAGMALVALLYFTYKVINPSRDNGTFFPELYLLPSMYFSWFLPFSLFLFGWAASVHWIVPMISEAFFLTAMESLFEATFSYFAEGYPNHVASAYAGNGLMRSVFACIFPIFGKAMYDRLAIKNYPVAWGSSLVGFITLFLAVIPFLLYKYGPALRAKSKFAD